MIIVSSYLVHTQQIADLFCSPPAFTVNNAGTRYFLKDVEDLVDLRLNAENTVRKIRPLK
jgi:hypothetical protein